MIFVTIGTQEPFDRLIKSMDEIAEILKDIPIIAQVSQTKYVAKNLKTFDFISPVEFDNYFSNASLIVSHAGMGTIISALVKRKPIIVLPRLTELGEHRSDHQMATAKKFESLNYINVAYNEEELKAKVLSIIKGDIKPMHQLGDNASNDLIESVRNFILEINGKWKCC